MNAFNRERRLDHDVPNNYVVDGYFANNDNNIKQGGCVMNGGKKVIYGSGGKKVVGSGIIGQYDPFMNYPGFKIR